MPCDYYVNNRECTTQIINKCFLKNLNLNTTSFIVNRFSSNFLISFIVCRQREQDERQNAIDRENGEIQLSTAINRRYI